MSTDNDRYQHLQSDVDRLRKQVQQLGNRAQEQPREPHKATRWDRINIWLMTTFTGLLFFSSMLQWSATRDAITDTHTSFEIGTRAWVVAKVCYIKPSKQVSPTSATVQEGDGLKDSRLPAISVELINAGHSPALEAVTVARFEVQDKLPTDDAVVSYPEDQIGSKTVVAPEEGLTVNHGVVLTEDQYQGVTHGKLFLVAYGKVSYQDIFRYPRTSKFCYLYDYTTEKMGYCPHFNSAN